MSKQEKLELEYLRYFYHAVDSSLGPASWDIYYYIREAYKGEVPERYKDEED